MRAGPRESGRQRSFVATINERLRRALVEIERHYGADVICEAQEAVELTDG